MLLARRLLGDGSGRLNGVVAFVRHVLVLATAPNRTRATVPPFQPVETVSFQKHAEPPTAGALDPPQGAAVALVADGAVFAQPHPAARGTPRPLDGHGLKNATTSGRRRRLSLVIDHGSDPPEAHVPDALNCCRTGRQKNVQNSPEFAGNGLDAVRLTCPHGVDNAASRRRRMLVQKEMNHECEEEDQVPEEDRQEARR